jgi:ABC-type Mn2+/Zn2+ transport system permease subunit
VEFLTDPWAWWVEPFQGSPFMQRAVLAGVLTALCTSVVGTWVVLRGMSFLGDALAHGVLPGIAIAFILDVNTTVGALVAAAVMVAGINLVRNHSPLPEDAGIGLLFVGMLALAVVVMSSNRASYSGDLSRFLFGSVTGVSASDLRWQASAAFVTVGASILLYRPLLVLTFDETQARLLGLRPRLAHTLLLGLLALAIVASFRTVGNLLVFAFLVAPPATATLLVRRVSSMMVVSAVVGSASAVVGILVSYHRASAAGATMALVSVLVFFVVLAGRSALGAIARKVRSADGADVAAEASAVVTARARP